MNECIQLSHMAHGSHGLGEVSINLAGMLAGDFTPSTCLICMSDGFKYLPGGIMFC